MGFDNLTIDGFDWDKGNMEKCQKDKVSIPEIENMFKNDLLTVFLDEKHSHLEERLIAIGKTQDKRPILIVFTIRKENKRRLIRPISARYMHRKEIKNYEEETAHFEK